MDHARAGAGTLETSPLVDNPLALLVARHGFVVLDGGLATQLEAQGNDLADPLWSARVHVENPGEITRAHLAFYRAGAAIATTASYQATFEGFAARGIDHAAAISLMRRSVALAAEAREAWRAERSAHDTGPLLAAASIGPDGAARADGAEYRGRYGRSVGELRDFHCERLEVLVATEADLLACETIPELEEGVALVELVEETPGARGWLSFSCADGARLRSGAPVEEAFALAEQSSRVLAIGVNCTAPQHVDELLERARSTTSKPLIVYPNSGERWDAVTRRWIDENGPTADRAGAWTRDGHAGSRGQVPDPDRDGRDDGGVRGAAQPRVRGDARPGRRGASPLGTGTDHRGVRRRPAGGDGWCHHVPPERARRGGCGGRRDSGRRQPIPPATRDPPLDDAPPAGRRPRARRAAGDPVGLGGRHLPAFRVRPRHAQRQLRDRARPGRVRAPGSRHGDRPPRGPRAGAGHLPRTLRPGPGRDARDGGAQRGMVALGDAPRHRPGARGKWHEVPGRLRGRRGRGRDGHLPRQARLGRARPEGPARRDRGHREHAAGDARPVELAPGGGPGHAGQRRPRARAASAPAAARGAAPAGVHGRRRALASRRGRPGRARGTDLRARRRARARDP